MPSVFIFPRIECEVHLKILWLSFHKKQIFCIYSSTIEVKLPVWDIVHN